MSPETILEQSKRVRLAEQYGWASYSREKPAVIPRTFDENRERFKKVTDYLSIVFAGGFSELQLDDRDKRSRLLPTYLAQCALSTYGWGEASVLHVGKTVKSDEGTSAALAMIAALNSSRPRIRDNHLFIPDFRVKPATIPEQRRYESVYGAVKAIEGGHAFVAVLPQQSVTMESSNQSSGAFNSSQATLLESTTS